MPGRRHEIPGFRVGIKGVHTVQDCLGSLLCLDQKGPTAAIVVASVTRRPPRQLVGSGTGGTISWSTLPHKRAQPFVQILTRESPKAYGH